MSAHQKFSAKVRAMQDINEAKALIRYLVECEAIGVSIRLEWTGEQARENVASRALEFLAGITRAVPDKK